MKWLDWWIDELIRKRVKEMGAWEGSMIIQMGKSTIDKSITRHDPSRPTQKSVTASRQAKPVRNPVVIETSTERSGRTRNEFPTGWGRFLAPSKNGYEARKVRDRWDCKPNETDWREIGGVEDSCKGRSRPADGFDERIMTYVESWESGTLRSRDVHVGVGVGIRPGERLIQSRSRQS